MADITASFRSGRRVSWRLTKQGKSQVSLQMPLVELVEEDVVDTGELGVIQGRRVSTPSVTNRMRVRALETSSKRTW